jgi:hypothetical protein
MVTRRKLDTTKWGSRGHARAVAVVSGVFSAVVVWSLASLSFGDLRQPAFGNATPQHVNAAIVVIASLIGGLLAWASLSLIERLGGRLGRVWTTFASLALAISLAPPLSGHGITPGNRVWLVSMHLVAGCVLITLLARTVTRSTRRGAARARR